MDATYPNGGLTLGYARESHARALRDERRAEQRLQDLTSEARNCADRLDDFREIRRRFEALYPELAVDEGAVAVKADSRRDFPDDATLRDTEPDASAAPSSVPELVRTALQARSGGWVRPGELVRELADVMSHNKAPDAKIRRILRDLNEQDEHVEVINLDGRSKGYRWRASSADARGRDDATQEEETA